ncbi:MAG TPA: nucleotidyl transferase AbiEii/AbiGii toxin family protein [Candidatus Sulfotelmatobacter sp.]|nr:nucleotidyl transferase AbiEii/AbiGii toxin family protein [Candidatus Sulfotelmatobacter sp.]
MNISREHLRAEAEATGFREDVLEKVLRLLGLLDGLRAHPFLKGRLALKGGTALNLFHFDVPRLSVDIDVNYIGEAAREGMLAEKPKIEEAVVAVCKRDGLTVRRMPSEHAGGKLQLRYQSALGQGGNLEVDLNFMLRVPLWPIGPMDSRPVGSHRATQTPLLDYHEIAAGKLAALLARHASRDLFDAHRLLATDLDRSQLRIAFVVYGAMNRRDWRGVSADHLAYEKREVENELLPLLRIEEMPGPRALSKWANALLKECRERLGQVLPLAQSEREFLDRLLERGEIAPDLITQDAPLAERISAHPGLLWKALNVRKHRGLE